MEHFEIHSFHKTGLIKHQFLLRAKSTDLDLYPDRDFYFILAKIYFGKYNMSVKPIKVMSSDKYFNDSNNEKACQNFLLKFLHRSKVQPILSLVDKNFDLLYLCESQHRKNYPTIDYKKSLWLYSIDNFMLRNRHNLEETSIKVPDDAAKFVMAFKKDVNLKKID